MICKLGLRGPCATDLLRLLLLRNLLLLSRDILQLLGIDCGHLLLLVLVRLTVMTLVAMLIIIIVRNASSTRGLLLVPIGTAKDDLLRGQLRLHLAVHVVLGRPHQTGRTGHPVRHLVQLPARIHLLRRRAALIVPIVHALRVPIPRHHQFVRAELAALTADVWVGHLLDGSCAHACTEVALEQVGVLLLVDIVVECAGVVAHTACAHGTSPVVADDVADLGQGQHALTDRVWLLLGGLAQGDDLPLVHVKVVSSR